MSTSKYLNGNGLSEAWLNIKNYIASQLLGYSQTGHTHSASDITSGLATVATSGSYNDLSNKPTIPKVNNATLTIQKNGTTVKTFTANSSTDITANITVPTKTSDLTNDSSYLSGTVSIANGGTGATTRLGAVQNLTNENVGTSTEYFLTITTNWGKAGYCSVGNAKSVLGVPTKTSQLTNDSGFLTNADRLPVGSYIQFAGSQAPEGFLVCNGGAISRTTYSALFAVIGTTYGGGDGWSTFNLPNLTDRFLQGSTTSGTVRDAGLPNITGSARIAEHGLTSFAIEEPQGCFVGQNCGWTNDNMVLISGMQNVLNRQLGMNASLSSFIYGNSSTVQPPALTCLVCIKY